jgi:7,8-dihydropterin-6-yl-methyl-4-(beta-D-ribofuranosyl)aminobenzene 5'-phosphate synthase
VNLRNATEKQLQRTIKYLKAIGTESVHACHCTDLKSKTQMAKWLELKEVGAGLVLEY